MIELKNLAVKYGDFTAVRHLNVAVRDGEFFTFLGPSGCGKTTTLRCIAGFEKAAEGEIDVAGKDISGLLPEERNLGFVFQSYALFPGMNVYENIAFGLRAHRVNKKVIEEKVKNIAERTGITEHLKKKVSDLSGGQQQRIAIARALVLEPRILLMDEPLSNLDAKLRVTMREEIKRLQKELGITTIYVTHDQEEAMAISDRIAVFNKGSIEQIGTPREIYDHPGTEFVAEFIGDINRLSGELETKVREKCEAKEDTVFYIRPQKLTVGDPGSCLPEEADVAAPAVVEEFEFQGSYSKVKMILEDGSGLFGLCFDNSSFCIGDKVTVSFRSKDILCFGGKVHE